MSLASLSEIIEDPEFHRLLLHGYAGPYSLGVIGSNRVLLSLPDVPESVVSIPQELDFKGIHVLVEVKCDWAQPHKLTCC